MSSPEALEPSPAACIISLIEDVEKPVSQLIVCKKWDLDLSLVAEQICLGPTIYVLLHLQRSLQAVSSTSSCHLPD